MNMKKIRAATMPEVMKKVKLELGDHAVILNSKIVYKGGFMGLFRKKMIEVVAAIDDKPLAVASTKINRERRTKESLSSPIQTKQNNEQQNVSKQLADVKKELSHLKQTSSIPLNHYPEEIQSCLLKLLAVDLEHRLIKKLGDQLLERWRIHREKPTESDIEDWCFQAILQDLQDISFEGIPEHVKIINFVGPTGVGKTTTIAKLAANAVLKEKKKVAFMTMDTYRIAAIEQLKTYAELLQVPLEVIYEEKNFIAAIDKYSDYDLIFIDTAGRNYREKRYIEELNKIFGIERNIFTYLVLSISMKEKDMHKIADNFLEMEFNQFIFTKADETNSYGVIYNMISHYQTGVSYITTGQDVPDDIIKATPESIAHYLVGNENNE
ncbi:flagellar biosynthesis protein FlhF [Bacillus sp. J14TS2]|uniref:flagellar biosynthesis protein FlhF n=1 Tax=Bacillus sp. J14TS2 TaxID=2807188 RepID=UPI001B09CF51|nr:flagellar biosynthesis protein FlhF [Bacillus sp. J14TS2]GIN70457.1 flagellar biosynthesis protein FlhF [Bacillus sp. J14TS2]